MYVEEELSGALQQGDVIRSIPFPYLQDENEKIVITGKGKPTPENWKSLDATPPSSKLCDDGRDKVFVIPTRSLHALVVSQSCDLERIEEGEDGRILLAAIIDEAEDELLDDHISAKKPSQAQAIVDNVFAAAVSNDKNVESALKKNLESIGKTREQYLTEIWLGERDGAFPLAARHIGSVDFPRSICYFAYMLSLPASWYALLKERRIMRIKDHWRSVLQESLAHYFGRFAYPGSKKDRLAVGGFGTKSE